MARLPGWREVWLRYGAPTTLKQGRDSARIYWMSDGDSCQAAGLVEPWGFRRHFYRVRAECDGVTLECFLPTRSEAACLLAAMLVGAYEQSVALQGLCSTDTVGPSHDGDPGCPLLWKIAAREERDYITPEDVSEVLEGGADKHAVRFEVLATIGKQRRGGAEDAGLCAFIAIKADLP